MAMREGHYFNEKCLLTSYWVFAIFFSSPQMLHDLSLYLLTLWKKNAFISFICLSPVKANQMLHLLETYRDVFRQGESFLLPRP